MKEKTITIPADFTLEKRHSRKFVTVLQRLYKTRANNVYLNFKQTTNTTKGDIMVLYAQLEKIKSKRIVNYFAETGKYSKIGYMLFPNNVLRLQKKVHPKQLHSPDTFRTLDPLIVSRITKDLQKIGINKNNCEHAVFCERIEALLTEIVANAIEHGIQNKEINCWLITDVNNKKREVAFTFVDMGKGIAQSHRDTKLPFKYILAGDDKIVLDSLRGSLISSTKELNRGKGLPEIVNIVEKNLVINFELITNKVAIDYNNNQFNCQKVPNFVGTCYSWAVTKDNFDIWRETQ